LAAAFLAGGGWCTGFPNSPLFVFTWSVILPFRAGPEFQLRDRLGSELEYPPPLACVQVAPSLRTFSPWDSTPPPFCPPKAFHAKEETFFSPQSQESPLVFLTISFSCPPNTLSYATHPPPAHDLSSEIRNHIIVFFKSEDVSPLFTILLLKCVDPCKGVNHFYVCYCEF